MDPLVGKRFGSRTVAHYDSGRFCYVLRCDCGATGHVVQTRVRASVVPDCRACRRAPVADMADSIEDVFAGLVDFRREDSAVLARRMFGALRDAGIRLRLD